ncbi:MAG: class I SAM-dependent methyltransferase [Acidobacteriota bacterium]|nr:class I SAM-dependent methyltransferase [Acidobacteriota bacterium]
MNQTVEYVGKDLEVMSFAVNYHKWILDEFRPFLGKNIVEVGAGTGSFSELLLNENPASLTLVEPSQMFEALQSKFGAIPKITTFQAIFESVADRIHRAGAPDSIVYVNVLEHIEDDLGELRIIHQTLNTKGKVFIFVPAMSWLYGEFDRRVGHFRRYAKDEIVQKCRESGFKILKVKYFDFFGVLPWYIKYRLLNSSELGGSAVTLYDKFAVPINKVVESVIKPPIGKNILLIAEKA